MKRGSQIVEIIRGRFLLGLAGVVVIGVLWVMGYFIIYKKLMGGKRSFTIKGLLLGFAWFC